MSELYEQMKAIAAAHASPVLAEVVERQRVRIAELERVLRAILSVDKIVEPCYYGDWQTSQEFEEARIEGWRVLKGRPSREEQNARMWAEVDKQIERLKELEENEQ